MKKFFIFILSLSAIMMICTNKSYAQTKTLADVNASSIGKSINFVKDGISKTKIGIFTDDFRYDLMKKSLMNYELKNETKEIITSSTRMSDVSKIIDSTISSQLGASTYIDGINISEVYGFSSDKDLTLNESACFSYVYFGHYTSKYELAVNPDYLNPDYLSSNQAFSQSFLNDIENLSKNMNDYSKYVKFFEDYGTHILSDILIGGKLQITSTYCSTKNSFSSSQVDELQNDVMAKTISLKTKNKLSSSVTTKMALNETVDKLQVNADFVGGNSVSSLCLNMNEEKNVGDYSNWIDSLNDETKCVPICAGGSGLKSIWSILPNKYATLKQTMEKMAIKYNDFEKKLNDYDTFDSINTGKLPKQLVREKEVTITDSGRLNQQMDYLNYDNINGLHKAQEYINAGYKKVTVTINLIFKNVYKGEQYFMLYYQKPSEKYLEDGKIVEFARSINNGEDHPYSFEATIDLSYLTNDGLVLLYGASGTGKDDWKNKMVYVTFNFF